MAQWINLNRKEQQVYVSMLIFCIVRKNWPYPPNASGSYGREGGRSAGEIQVGFETFKIFYRLNYSGFYLILYHCNITTVLKLHFRQLLSSKACFKV